MMRCRRCVIPNTRPDTPFTDGICAACLAYDARQTIDWEARKADLHAVLERGRNTSGYDCIVPSSGGKDSTWQVLKLIDFGARPLVVTATTCHLTPIGRKNIDNLARYATTIEVSPRKTARAALNRLGLNAVGDISWPEHAGIFTTPFRIACALGIPLIFYGENPQNQYGGPKGTEEARQMTARWVSEFGGFNGLRADDAIGYDGIVTAQDMEDYRLPSPEAMAKVGVEAHFLGHYLPWDSHKNAERAKAAGMIQVLPSSANLWPHENLDNAQTGIHDHAMYRKYGYGRLAAQVSVDIRAGLARRDHALEWVQEWDGELTDVYMGVELGDILERIQITEHQLRTALDRFTNWDLFQVGLTGHSGRDWRPKLKEEQA